MTEMNKEDIKMARMELDEERLDEVVGGAFNYYTNSKGQRRCYVDTTGAAYYCSADAFGAVAAYSSDTTKTVQEIVDWALANGYFSTNPM
ncbi:MAG: hypothetical protein IK127_07920 [Clostridia bacterium]|nr:hypothetical protein [Clostridia bacterium]